VGGKARNILPHHRDLAVIDGVDATDEMQLGRLSNPIVADLAASTGSTA
jgi:hypothetical protein